MPAQMSRPSPPPPLAATFFAMVAAWRSPFLVADLMAFLVVVTPAPWLSGLPPSLCCVACSRSRACMRGLICVCSWKPGGSVDEHIGWPVGGSHSHGFIGCQNLSKRVAADKRDVLPYEFSSSGMAARHALVVSIRCLVVRLLHCVAESQTCSTRTRRVGSLAGLYLSWAVIGHAPRRSYPKSLHHVHPVCAHMSHGHPVVGDPPDRPWLHSWRHELRACAPQPCREIWHPVASPGFSAMLPRPRSLVAWALATWISWCLSLWAASMTA